MMRNLLAAAIGAAALAFAGFAHADTVVTERPVPLAEAPALKGATIKPVKPGPLSLPTITWGADVTAVYGDQSGAFKKEGLDVRLTHEDNFAKQVRSAFDGETPFVRGTFGMINAAAEAFHNAGQDLVVVHQFSWSRGGDRLVVRPGINKLEDLRGKRIGLQLYGPHMDYATTVLARAGLKPTDVNFVWFKELSVPTYDTKGQTVDPRTAFQSDPSLDAVFVITPDADVLTSNNAKTGGTGAEGSVKGAKVLFSTISADHVIADVWAVRADWFNANRATVEKVVHAMLVSNEQFDAVRNDKSRAKELDATVVGASKLFENSKDDVTGMLGDADFVGFQGNVAFFTGNGTTRNFAVMKDEIQNAFVTLKLMKGTAPIQTANWDYTKLAAGLSNVDLTAIPAPKFDAKKVQQTVETQIQTETATWDEEGSLFLFEINFKANQSTFSADQYADAFKKVLDLNQTFGGALITVEGHNAPDVVNTLRSIVANQDLTAKQRTALSLIGMKSFAQMQKLDGGAIQDAIKQAEAGAKNTSKKRANAVRDAYIAYAKSQNVTVDESQLIAVGMGSSHPKFAVPATQEEWAANMRVVFRVKQVETEMESFQAPGK